MMKNIKILIKNNALLCFVWVTIIGLILWNLWPLLVNKIPSGWDTVPHYYLLETMVKLLSQGQLSGYDASWFGGYPVFTFYGPLVYVLMAFVYFASFMMLGLPFIFGLFLVFIPLLFFVAINYTSRIWFGKKSLIYASLFAWFFLTASKASSFTGIGLSAVVYLGLIANLWAIALMVFLFGVLKKLESEFTWKYFLIATGLWAAIILSHSLTMVFTVALFGFYLLLQPSLKKLKIVTLVIGSGIVLSLWWLIPFFQNLSFAGGQKLIGVPNSGTIFTHTFRELRVEEFMIWRDFSFEKLVEFPLPTLVFFVMCILGIKECIKHKEYFWALPFALGMLILPEHEVYWELPFPLHYYRFMPHIFVLGVLVAAFGFTQLKVNFSPKLKKLNHALLVFAILFMMGAPSNFDLHESFLNKSADYTYYPHLYEYPDYADAEKVMNYLSEQPLEGRVAVQTKWYDAMSEIGTPHYLQTFLPLKYDIPVVPGLLAESSLSMGYINPVLTTLIEGLVWGRTNLRYNDSFTKLSKDSLIKRLALFNVEYLVVSRDLDQELLNEISTEILELKAEFGRYKIYRLNNVKPFLTQNSWAPFLFVDNGGVDFRTFAESWYLVDEFLNRPFIYHPHKDFFELNQNEQENIGGLIVSMNSTNVSLEDYNKWRDTGKKVIFLNAEPPKEDFIEDTEVVFSQPNATVNQFKEKYFSLVNEEKEIIQTKVKTMEESDELVLFDANGGVLINYSYFPRWKSVDPDQNVFWATPSMMYVFAKGETELFYD